jgi:uncharacterized phage protein (TIGR01671 family)
MREIKFRIWDKKLNCFFYTPKNPLAGSWLTKDKKMVVNFPCLDIDLYGRSGYEHRFEYKNLKEAQQFTGLFDRDGDKIFEGDILNCRMKSFLNKKPDEEFILGYVDFCEIFGQYMAFKNEEDINGIPAYKYAGLPNTKLEHGCKIIGNIFENKELLVD